MRGNLELSYCHAECSAGDDIGEPMVVLGNPRHAAKPRARVGNDTDPRALTFGNDRREAERGNGMSRREGIIRREASAIIPFHDHPRPVPDVPPIVYKWTTSPEQML